MDAWWAIEDLWRRIARHLAVEVWSGDNRESQLIFHAFRHWSGADANDLRHRLFDTELYGWQVGDSEGFRAGQGTRGSLLRLLDYEGDGLKLTLAPYRLIERMPQGAEVSFLIKACLIELQVRGAELASASRKSIPNEKST
ncbi:hypothetical protein LNV09_20695 [Paucibacter sp. B2R-40]|nr:hypothetical protein [Paucibacter sp. B2R-40]